MHLVKNHPNKNTQLCDLYDFEVSYPSTVQGISVNLLTSAHVTCLNTDTFLTLPIQPVELRA